MFFEIDSNSFVKDVDFLEEIGTLYDLLIYLLGNSTRITTSTQVQLDFFKVITVLKKIISSMKTDIADKSEEEKKKIFAKQENFLSNAEMLLEKRNELIKQFSKNNIISKGDKFYGALKKSEESISEKSEQESDDQSIPKWMLVSKDRFDFIRLKINKNKDLATMINSERYTLNDANKLINKIAEKKIGKNNAIKEYNNLVNKAEQIKKLRSTNSRQKILKIFNYLEETFIESTGEGLKILTSN